MYIYLLFCSCFQMIRALVSREFPTFCNLSVRRSVDDMCNYCAVLIPTNIAHVPANRRRALKVDRHHHRMHRVIVVCTPRRETTRGDWEWKKKLKKNVANQVVSDAMCVQLSTVILHLTQPATHVLKTDCTNSWRRRLIILYMKCIRIIDFIIAQNRYFCKQMIDLIAHKFNMKRQTTPFRTSDLPPKQQIQNIFSAPAVFIS